MYVCLQTMTCVSLFMSVAVYVIYEHKCVYPLLYLTSLLCEGMESVFYDFISVFLHQLLAALLILLCYLLKL
jgi:hypothetical protein